MPTLVEAMATVWRVKLWRVTVNFGATLEIEPELAEGVENEADLVCTANTQAASGKVDSLIAPENGWGLALPEAPLRIGDSYAARLYIATPNEDISATRTGFCTFSLVGAGASWTVEPAEWWPYDPGDGRGPIYSAATGAQLREFPD